MESQMDIGRVACSFASHVHSTNVVEGRNGRGCPPVIRCLVSGEAGMVRMRPESWRLCSSRMNVKFGNTLNGENVGGGR